MVGTHHQVLWVPNNAVAQIITPAFRERARACDSSTYCITTESNDTNLNKFPPPWVGAIRISDKRNIALKIQPVIRQIIARLIIAM